MTAPNKGAQKYVRGDPSPMPTPDGLALNEGTPVPITRPTVLSAIGKLGRKEIWSCAEISNRNISSTGTYGFPKALRTSKCCTLGGGQRTVRSQTQHGLTKHSTPPRVPLPPSTTMTAPPVFQLDASHVTPPPDVVVYLKAESSVCSPSRDVLTSF